MFRITFALLAFTASLPASTPPEDAMIEKLIPTDVVAGATIPADSTLKIEATYKDHQLTSPTAITFDDQGRIYISETHRFHQGVEDDRDHLYWYLDDLASKNTADRRALHEKWNDKVPTASLTQKSEVIRRLADTDGDGKIDESKVFADGYNDLLDGTAAGIFYYAGSLYFACIPKIQMLRDTNDDGVADERKTVEEGFGVRVSLSGHDLNGFALGPDGRIYGTVGDRGLSFITKDGVSIDYPNEGAAFRFEPDGSGFEIFYTGLRNPKEIAFDALGNAFSVDNNSDQGDKARVVYLAEGGDSGWQMEHQAMHTFHRQIGLADRPPSRWMDEKMWELQNPAQPAFMLPPAAQLTNGPSGLTSNPGAGFLASEAGRFLICDYRGSAANSGIWSFAMKPKGAGMELSDARQFVWGVAATDVEYSWDGKIYISDFITGWVSHEDGRLLSLDAGTKMWQATEAAGVAKIMKEGFEQRSSAVLANLLKHPDARIRLRAQIALTRKSDARERFIEAADSSDFMVRIHGIQGLGILSRRGSVPQPYAAFGDIPTAKNRKQAEQKLIALLKDKNPEIRAQSLRALAGSKNDGGSIPISMLLSDESPRVRFFAAILVGKLKMIAYYGPICEMLAENNNRDVYLRHAGIYALQHMAPNPGVISALSGHDSPAVRLAATVALRRLKSSNVATFIQDADPQVADEAIRAVCDLDMVSRRPVAAEQLDDLTQRPWTPFMLRRLIHNAFRIGTPENAARLLKLTLDSTMPEIVRMEALRLLDNWTEPFPVDQFTGIWRPLKKRDLASIKPSLLAAMPELLKQNDFVLTAALKMVKHYQLELPALDDAALRSFIKNGKLPAEARTAALDLFIASKPKSLDTFLSEITSDSSDEIALTALAAVAKFSPAAALAPIEAAVNSSQVPRAQKAWDILATLPGESVDVIFTKKIDELRTANGISPSAIELIAAARKRAATAVKNALSTFDKSLAENSDPLATWNSALEGGDPVAGAALFASHPVSQCMRCHRAEEGHAAGGESAPNLAGIVNRHPDRRYFLESMIHPSTVIAAGFGALLIDFKNGATLSGNLIAETPDHLDINAAGKSLRVNRADIASLTPPASPMPPMGDLLNPSELRDLVAWLASLNTGGESPKTISEPTLLDPATLKITTDIASIDPAFLKKGRQQFMVCGACHGQGGEGTAAAPPLAGSEWVNGPEENLIRIQLRGLRGPIQVKGQEYNMPAGMAALAYQSDEQIAAVLTYVRSSFGNSAPAVSPAAVTALRGEVGKPQLTASDLTSLTPKSSALTTEPTSTTPSGKYDSLIPKSSYFSYLKWLALGIGLVTAVAVMRMKKK